MLLSSKNINKCIVSFITKTFLLFTQVSILLLKYRMYFCHLCCLFVRYRSFRKYPHVNNYPSYCYWHQWLLQYIYWYMMSSSCHVIKGKVLASSHQTEEMDKEFLSCSTLLTFARSHLNSTLKNHKVRKTRFGEASFFLGKVCSLVFETGWITQCCTQQFARQNRNKK